MDEAWRVARARPHPAGRRADGRGLRGDVRGRDPRRLPGPGQRRRRRRVRARDGRRARRRRARAGRADVVRERGLRVLRRARACVVLGRRRRACLWRPGRPAGPAHAPLHRSTRPRCASRPHFSPRSRGRTASASASASPSDRTVAPARRSLGSPSSRPMDTLPPSPASAPRRSPFWPTCASTTTASGSSRARRPTTTSCSGPRAASSPTSRARPRARASRSRPTR